MTKPSDTLLVMLVQIRLISKPDSFLERGAGAPAKPGKTADVEQFARRAVRPRGVEADFAGIANGRGHHAGEFGDGDVLAGADIDQFVAGIDLPHFAQANVPLRRPLPAREHRACGLWSLGSPSSHAKASRLAQTPTVEPRNIQKRQFRQE